MTVTPPLALSRLLYVSRCALSLPAAELDLEVRRMAERAALRNREVDLTGSLLHMGATFIQVLEGPAPAVEETFERICCDFRHEDLKLLDFVPVKDRVFPEWSMAFLSADSEATLTLRDDMEDIRLLVGLNAREAISQMRRLLETQPA